jgi:hypothetical protein
MEGMLKIRNSTLNVLFRCKASESVKLLYIKLDPILQEKLESERIPYIPLDSSKLCQDFGWSRDEFNKIIDEIRKLRIGFVIEKSDPVFDEMMSELEFHNLGNVDNLLLMDFFELQSKKEIMDFLHINSEAYDHMIENRKLMHKALNDNRFGIDVKDVMDDLLVSFKSILLGGVNYVKQ